MRLEQLHPTWRREQSERLIVDAPKRVAIDAGYSIDWIYDLRNAVHPVAAITAFHLAKIQDDVRFLQALAVRYGYLLIPRPLPEKRRSPILLLGDFAATTSKVIESLIAKIHRNEKLTEKEAMDLEALIDKGHTDLEALREAVREQRKEPTP